jgi:hypothetical protein
MTAEIVDATTHDVEGELFCYSAMFPHAITHEFDDPLLAYKAVSNPDTLYYHEAMREIDEEEFQFSMHKELNDQFENGNFTVVHRSEVK